MNKYMLLRVFFIIVSKLIAKVEISGLENVPLDKPFILASNHLTFLDSPILMLALPVQITALVARKWEKIKWARFFLNIGGAIFIHRDKIDTKALRASLKVLKEGGVLGIAPEGTRSRTGGLIQAKPGVAYLSSKISVPILPVGISGHANFESDLRNLKRFPVHVNIGKLIYLPQAELRGVYASKITSMV
ncbi:MAG: hypothetical protein B6242_13135 [Anaerolineaceae bacterium 4572_78]|nr:MAG: hypothetical protein B6242_13135 [Anaerolineaceae bacterium 4572_78]